MRPAARGQRRKGGELAAAASHRGCSPVGMALRIKAEQLPDELARQQGISVAELRCPQRRCVAHEDDVALVAGLAQRPAAGDVQLAVGDRGLGDGPLGRGAVGRLGRQPPGLVGLVPDRPDADPGQQGVTEVGGVVGPRVAQADGADEGAELGRVRAPRGRVGSMRRTSARPRRSGTGHVEVDGDPARAGIADQPVVAVPVDRRIAAGLRRLEAAGEGRRRAGVLSDDAPHQRDADRVDAQRAHLVEGPIAHGKTAIQQRVVVLHDRDLVVSRPRGGGEGAAEKAEEQRQAGPEPKPGKRLSESQQGGGHRRSRPGPARSRREHRAGAAGKASGAGDGAPVGRGPHGGAAPDAGGVAGSSSPAWTPRHRTAIRSDTGRAGPRAGAGAGIRRCR